MIAQRLNLPAQIGDPLVRVRTAEGAVDASRFASNEPQPTWAVAIGLSLGAAKAA
jgi:Tfp pilus assembly PilM family ATPase